MDRSLLQGKWKDSLDLEGWDDTSLDFQADVPSARLDLEGCTPPETLRLAVQVHRSGLPGAYEFNLTGDVTAMLTLTCVRCLAEFPWHLDAPFDRRYLHVSAMPLGTEGEEHEILDEEVDIEYYRRPVFDLLSLVREQVYLELPMDPVCRESCVGLCPYCGADRNLGEHECAKRPADPRWGDLLHFKPSKIQE